MSALEDSGTNGEVENDSQEPPKWKHQTFSTPEAAANELMKRMKEGEKEEERQHNRKISGDKEPAPRDSRASSVSSSGGFHVVVSVMGGQNLLPRRGHDSCDAFCKVLCADDKAKTKVVKSDSNPEWRETFHFRLASLQSKKVNITVWDTRGVRHKKRLIGEIDLPPLDALTTSGISGWLPLHLPSESPLIRGARKEATTDSSSSLSVASLNTETSSSEKEKEKEERKRRGMLKVAMMVEKISPGSEESERSKDSTTATSNGSYNSTPKALRFHLDMQAVRASTTAASTTAIPVMKFDPAPTLPQTAVTPERRLLLFRRDRDSVSSTSASILLDGSSTTSSYAPLPPMKREDIYLEGPLTKLNTSQVRWFMLTPFMLGYYKEKDRGKLEEPRTRIALLEIAFIKFMSPSDKPPSTPRANLLRLGPARKVLASKSAGDMFSGGGGLSSSSSASASSSSSSSASSSSNNLLSPMPVVKKKGLSTNALLGGSGGGNTNTENGGSGGCEGGDLQQGLIGVERKAPANTSFLVTTTSVQERTLYLQARNANDAALWVLAIDALRRGGPGRQSAISVEEKDAIMKYLYLEGYKGAILKSSYEEEWQYTGKGVLRADRGMDPEDEGLTYVWNGSMLRPANPPPDVTQATGGGSITNKSYGCGTWDGVWLSWYALSPEHDLAPFLVYKWNRKEREYQTDDPALTWKWTRHFLACKNASGEWIVEGEVPEPVVMMLQILRYIRCDEEMKRMYQDALRRTHEAISYRHQQQSEKDQMEKQQSTSSAKHSSSLTASSLSSEHNRKIHRRRRTKGGSWGGSSDVPILLQEGEVKETHHDNNDNGDSRVLTVVKEEGNGGEDTRGKHDKERKRHSQGEHSSHGVQRRSGASSSVAAATSSSSSTAAVRKSSSSSSTPQSAPNRRRAVTAGSTSFAKPPLPSPSVHDSHSPSASQGKHRHSKSGDRLSSMLSSPRLKSRSEAEKERLEREKKMDGWVRKKEDTGCSSTSSSASPLSGSLS
ncbi:PH domain-containing protein [Balamuthia mandrillaris]